MSKQIDKKCQDCLHYKMCLERFRKLKKENHYILIDENEYFAHADDCEFHIKSTDVARKIFEEIEKIVSKEMHKCETLRGQEKEASERKYWEGGEHSLRQLGYWFAELKKKYESEGA